MVTEPTINAILDHLRARARMPLPDFIASGKPLAGSTAELADLLGAVQVDEKTLQPLDDILKEDK